MDKKVKSFFDRHPNINEVFECGGKLYYTRGAADSNGNGKVKTFYRKDLKANTKASNDSTKTE